MDGPVVEVFAQNGDSAELDRLRDDLVLCLFLRNGSTTGIIALAGFRGPRSASKRSRG